MEDTLDFYRFNLKSVNFKMSLWFHRLDKITNEIISEFLP